MSNFFKVALFALACSVVCTVGYIITNITIMAILTNWMWLLTYGTFVVWLCSKLHKRVRYSGNLIIMLASFAMALFFGVRVSFTDGLENINTLFAVSLDATLFIVAALLCLIATMLFLGRLIFGKPRSDNQVDASTAGQTIAPHAGQPMTPPAGQTAVNHWTCSCGNRNTGNFCSACGSSKSE